MSDALFVWGALLAPDVVFVAVRGALWDNLCFDAHLDNSLLLLFLLSLHTRLEWLPHRLNLLACFVGLSCCRWCSLIDLHYADAYFNKIYYYKTNHGIKVSDLHLVTAAEARHDRGSQLRRWGVSFAWVLTRWPKVDVWVWDPNRQARAQKVYWLRRSSIVERRERIQHQESVGGKISEHNERLLATYGPLDRSNNISKKRRMRDSE